MTTIIVKIVPQLLSNPDLDIRSILPDLINRQSGGVVEDDGYDYAQDQQSLLLFLTTQHIEEAVACVVHIVEQVRVLDNDLRKAVTVAIEKSTVTKSFIHPIIRVISLLLRGFEAQ